MTQSVDENVVLKELGKTLSKIVKHHFVIRSKNDPDTLFRQKYIIDLFRSMGIEHNSLAEDNVSFTFFEICSEDDVDPLFLRKIIGHYIRNNGNREYEFIKSKYKRATLILTYYLLWEHCQHIYPNENIMIWEDSVVINNKLLNETFLDILNQIKIPEQFDLLLLGHFFQKFRTYYCDDGRSRLKCDVPINGYCCFNSQYLLKLSYGFQSGTVIYSPNGIDKLIKEFETMVEDKNIYPIECFIAGMMDKMDVYCITPSLFGQILDFDSVVVRNVPKVNLW